MLFPWLSPPRLSVRWSKGETKCGDDVEVELGWGDETALVFTGRVAAIEPRFGFALDRLG